MAKKNANVDEFVKEFGDFIGVSEDLSKREHPRFKSKVKKSLLDKAYTGIKMFRPSYEGSKEDLANDPDMEKLGLGFFQNSNYSSAAYRFMKQTDDLVSGIKRDSLETILGDPVTQELIVPRLKNDGKKAFSEYGLVKTVDAYGNGDLGKDQNKLVRGLAVEGAVEVAREHEKKRQGKIGSDYADEDLLDLVENYAGAAVVAGRIKDSAVKRYALNALGGEKTGSYKDAYKALLTEKGDAVMPHLREGIKGLAKRDDKKEFDAAMAFVYNLTK